MVRGKKFTAPTSSDQTRAQKIWTLQDYQRDLSCGVSASTTSDMDDPRCVPRVTLIAL